jgi:putative hydrolase phosphatase protein
MIPQLFSCCQTQKNRLYKRETARQRRDGMKRAYLFDVDGTLWDSARAVTDSWNEVLKARRGSGTLTVDDMHGFMGHTMDEIAARISPDADPLEQKEIMEACMRHEIDYLESHSGCFYPGVLKTLRALFESGKELYIVSNCQEGYIESLLEAGNLSSGEDGVIRDFICYGETRRPKGENIELILERNELSPEEVVYIGDTEMDQAAAEEAGVDFYHVSYGFGRVHGALRELDSLEELLED